MKFSTSTLVFSLAIAIAIAATSAFAPVFLAGRPAVALNAEVTMDGIAELMDIKLEPIRQSQHRQEQMIEYLVDDLDCLEQKQVLCLASTLARVC